MTPERHLLPDEPALFEALADRLIGAARAALRERGAFHLALTGGTTPRGLYRRLAERQGELEWQRIHLWFGDERCVPPDHPDSNYAMAWESLIRHLPVAAAQVHRMEGERPPAEAAADYTALLTRLLPREGALLRFDLVLLGVGPDGHIASLFPGTAALEAPGGCTAVYVPKLDAWRLTLTYPLLNAARELLLLVSGTGKAEMVARVLGGSLPAQPLPVQRLHPAGPLAWYLDAAAAAQLPEGG